jgi:hypothetical protein
MKTTVRIAAAAATLVLMGAGASTAHAQSQPSNLSGLTVRVEQRTQGNANDTRWGTLAPARTFQLNSRKWGLKLDLDQQVGREAGQRDMQAGAYYRLTPSVKVGGAVRLEDKTESQRNLTPRDQQPRVRLETLFQF